jgi:hypothetical protein
MKYLLHILFAALMVLVEGLALASHFKGGELVYEYLGSGQYKIKAYSYWTSGCSLTFTHSAANITINSALTKTSDTTANGTQECIYEETVTYSGSAEDVISYGGCCRVSGANFTSSASFGFSTKIIYNADNDSLNSSSPIFGSKPFYTFSSASDSISFSLNASLPSGPTDKTWAYRRFSLSTPIGLTSTVYDDMSGLSINALTGTVSWTSPTTGLWLVNVKIEEADSNGNLTGAYIFRDFMLTVSNTTNSPPTISSIATNYLLGVSSATYQLTVNATDPDGDNVTLTATGVPFNLTANAATFTQNGAGSTVSATMQWTQPTTGFYALQFTATDNNAVSLFKQLDVTISIDLPLALDTTLDCSSSPCTGTAQALDPASLPLTYSISTAPSNGTVTITNSSTGAFTYTPSANYKGTDVFAFRAQNAIDASNQGTVTINVNIVQDPNTEPDFLALGELTSCLVHVSGSFSCWGDGTLSKIPSFASAFDAILPTPSSTFTVDGVQTISMGRRHGCFLRSNGEVACFGEGSAGQLGHGAAPASSGGLITVSGFGN